MNFFEYGILYCTVHSELHSKIKVVLQYCTVQYIEITTYEYSNKVITL